MPKVVIDKADRRFSQWVRLRDRQCLRCGSAVKFNSKGLPVSHNASHFMGRGKENTRFDPDNVCTLDYGCHQYFTAHPAEHYEWQVKRLGQKKVDELRLASSLFKKKDRVLEAIYWQKKLLDDFEIKA